LRFTVQRPGHRLVSPRGMPCRYVRRGVQVGIAGVSAGRADVQSLALATVRIHVPALRATLARVRRVYFLNTAGGFVLQEPGEHAPALLKDRPVQSGLGPDVPAGNFGRSAGRPGHVGDLQSRCGSRRSCPRCWCWFCAPSPSARPRCRPWLWPAPAWLAAFGCCPAWLWTASGQGCGCPSASARRTSRRPTRPASPQRHGRSRQPHRYPARRRDPELRRTRRASGQPCRWSPGRTCSTAPDGTT
jgi:hypothetical protein